MDRTDTIADRIDRHVKGMAAASNDPVVKDKILRHLKGLFSTVVERVEEQQKQI